MTQTTIPTQAQAAHRRSARLGTPRSNVTPAMTIDLSTGHPHNDLLPLHQFHSAMLAQITRMDHDALQYGYEGGDPLLREHLSQWLSLPLNELMISAGISQAIDLCAGMLTRPGDTILVEESTFFRVLQIFRDHHLNIIPVPITDEGLDLDALEHLCQTHQPTMLYSIPSAHNPTGVTTSLAHRARLYQLALEYRFTLLADEAYQFLSHEQDAPQSFSRFPSHPHVITLGSFSKIVTPGLRLGWIHAHPDTLTRLQASGMLGSGGGFSPVMMALLARMFEQGTVTQHLQRVNAELAQRRQALCTLLEQHHVPYQTPQGGYFIWATLPDHDQERGTFRAQHTSVTVSRGERFGAAPHLRQYARLCFAFEHEGNFAQAVQVLSGRHE